MKNNFYFTFSRKFDWSNTYVLRFTWVDYGETKRGLTEHANFFTKELEYSCGISHEHLKRGASHSIRKCENGMYESTCKLEIEVIDRYCDITRILRRFYEHLTEERFN